MIDYRLHVFRQVAEVGSLTKASKALHLSQPAVSKHIKLLEEELRVPLFIRSSSGVVLTDAGEAVHKEKGEWFMNNPYAAEVHATIRLRVASDRRFRRPF